VQRDIRLAQQAREALDRRELERDRATEKRMAGIRAKEAQVIFSSSPQYSSSYYKYIGL
jgi:hypothetical protein